jgi:Tripartite tricarboxylate transporter family receptor
MIGFGPGSGADISARIIGARVSTLIGQQLVIENKAGAGSSLAAELVARAPKDGYTLLLGSISQPINAAVVKSLTLNFARDFTPICLVATMLALARSYELQQRLSTLLHEHENSNGTTSITRMPRVGGPAFDPEVVAIMASAFGAVFADLGLSDRDDAVALRAARRIIELAAAGARDPETLRAATIRWVTEWAKASRRSFVAPVEPPLRKS